MTRDTSPRWSDCSIPPRKSPPTSRSTARSPRACARAGWRSSSARSTCSARARRCAPSLESGQPHSMVLYGPPGTGKTTLARLAAEHAARGVRGALGRQRRPRRGARGDRPRPRAPRRAARPRDDLLPRRDPPLQQGPAGRAAARGRGGAADADRRDDREPLLRGQLRAALARPGLRAAGARRRRRRGAAAARARARRRRGDRGPRRGRSPSSACAPAATRARR